METLAALWLPILLSAVFVFLASSVIHMALPIHKGDYKKLPDEAATLEAMRRTGVVPGQYMFPCAASMKDFGSPEMQAKMKQGPVGVMIVRNGACSMGAALTQWFIFCVVISYVVAWMTFIACHHDAAGVFRFALVSAFVGYGLSSVTDSIWKGLSWVTTAKFLFDGLVYGLVTAATFAWLWPAAKPV